ncbi:cyclic nucleotide-binding domain protein [Cyanobium sp. PCC 7001]|uniref:cyclic nucleotide-binding domain-containing protein n=1 Tax=Cyanobium sp. PCC 7001 TaxID=180281 RepID=UPI000180544A|nr:cyclic nucleotide-binding domain-containing protein [Cyanobium sp. PCC 7001]EDY37977.1 cyclic nucleotide-binding domain protein [Cyanobium sp. PCC 7001]
MRIFARWPERQAHAVRWLLLLGWLALIASLLIPPLGTWALRPPLCPAGLDCHGHGGNQLFWGAVVPTGLLILAAGSHELWRRLCPLAFVSQLFRGLDRQRRVTGRNGRPQVAKVESDSWLGRHHLALQWCLLIAGLCLRLLAVNSSPVGLGLLLLLTVLAAIAVGWAYAGRAWCQYVCPMGAVQQVITGPRGPLASAAHLDPGRITQSMCRTLGDDAQERSACVACQSPCIDIDSERTYWAGFEGRRGLRWAWLSYPGLVLAFFLLSRQQGPQAVEMLRSGLWAFDADLPARALDLWPRPDAGWGMPRLLAIPALLSAAGAGSVALFGGLERALQTRLAADHSEERARAMARSRTRLLATFTAVNLFFWFADPSLGAAEGKVGQLIRSLVLIASAIWLYRGWPRDAEVYRRESTGASLRSQLRKRFPGLEAHLGGRTLEELTPGEVFTLAKALPAQLAASSQALYRDVLADLFRGGRLERATSAVQLEELRLALGLEEADHHTAIRELELQDPELLELDGRQRASRNLREEAAAEAIQDLLQFAGQHDLRPELLQPSQARRLERIRQDSGLEDGAWQQLLLRFGPRSDFARRQLERGVDALQGELARRAALAVAARDDNRIRPLLPVCDLRIVGCLLPLLPLLSEFRAGDDDDLLQRFAALQALLPSAVVGELLRRDLTLLPHADPGPALELEPLPDPLQAIEELWNDPDPENAVWVLWLLEQRDPARAARLRRTPRTGLPVTPHLQGLMDGRPLAEAPLLELLLRVPLLAELSPSALFNVASWGTLQAWPAGAPLLQAGEEAAWMAILLEGSVLVSGVDWQARVTAGETLGEMALLSGRSRGSAATAEKPVQALVFDAGAFEQLLHQSSGFARSLLRQQTRRIEGMQGEQC